ncbi:alpha/beta fold hydrolase [Pseudonocardia spirodelae]|uniref:Alpha/beta hydrolase n=1 Tax=Pseudonocardia spirodelae TaxID=3133431 RepID=A0ABU8TEN6_9PSEU
MDISPEHDPVTRFLHRPDADLAYDVHGPDLAPGERVLLCVGQPMDAGGFRDLAAALPDRRVVAYDPRGLGRSTRSDGLDTSDPHVQAADLHALVGELGGPVEVFASSGGAITALALVQAHPGDVAVLVAHEPPLIGELPDADLARRGWQAVRATYDAHGSGAGMAAFLGWTSWSGPFTEEHLAAGPPDPAAFGLPTGDDGRRDDPLLSARAAAMLTFVPDAAALAAAPTRVVLAVGEETGDAVTARTTRALADRLGLDVAVFPSHHGGFAGAGNGWPGRPAEFAARLREVLG